MSSIRIVLSLQPANHVLRSLLPDALSTDHIRARHGGNNIA